MTTGTMAQGHGRGPSGGGGVHHPRGAGRGARRPRAGRVAGRPPRAGVGGGGHAAGPRLRAAFLDFHDSGMAGSDTVDDPGRRSPPRRSTAPRPARPSPYCSATRPPTSSPSTTSGVATSTPTTSRSTGSACGPPLADTPRLYAATVSADHLRELMERQRAETPDLTLPDPDSSTSASPTIASPPGSTSRPISGPSGRRWPLASQIAEETFFLSLPPDVFALTLRHRVVRAPRLRAPRTGDLVAVTSALSTARGPTGSCAAAVVQAGPAVPRRPVRRPRHVRRHDQRRDRHHREVVVHPPAREVGPRRVAVGPHRHPAGHQRGRHASSNSSRATRIGSVGGDRDRAAGRSSRRPR